LRNGKAATTPLIHWWSKIASRFGARDDIARSLFVPQWRPGGSYSERWI
jgi:hypothetical protein